MDQLADTAAPTRRLSQPASRLAARTASATRLPSPVCDLA